MHDHSVSGPAGSFWLMFEGFSVQDITCEIAWVLYVDDILKGVLATTAMLVVQPRHYTTWNVRKRLILDAVISLESDLFFSSLVLHTHPKKHECWSHRLWTFERALEKCLDKRVLLTCELELCERLAGKAPRNFYAWQHCHRVSAEILNCCLSSDNACVKVGFIITASSFLSFPSTFTTNQIVPRRYCARPEIGFRGIRLISRPWFIDLCSSQAGGEFQNARNSPCFRRCLVWAITGDSFSPVWQISCPYLIQQNVSRW